MAKIDLWSRQCP